HPAVAVVVDGVPADGLAPHRDPVVLVALDLALRQVAADGPPSVEGPPLHPASFLHARPARNGGGRGSGGLSLHVPDGTCRVMEQVGIDITAPPDQVWTVLAD